jgi:hypothetical protein
MVLKTITFDERNPCWVTDVEVNIMFLRHKEVHLNDILLHYGYLYLNQIFEQLYATWNPDDENLCLRSTVEGKTAVIRLEISNDSNNSFAVNIHYDH